jgi:hypothetical protein
MALETGDPYAFVISANIQRRHLTSEQKRELIDKLLKAQPERSDRVTAKLAKTDHKTVAAQRSKLEATGEIPQLDERVGADKKTRRKESSSKRPKSSKRPTGSKSPAKEAARFLPAELRDQNIDALCARLMDGEIRDSLEDLCLAVSKQMSRISEIPLPKRVKLARDFLTALGLTLDDLRSVENGGVRKQAA